MALPGVNPTYRYLDDGAPDGTILGQTTAALVAFWGATPTSQRAATNQSIAASTAAVSVSATQWGYTTSTQATGIATLVWEMRDALVKVGIIKGSI